MSRLTEKDVTFLEDVSVLDYLEDSEKIDEIYKKLAEYEDTRLEPQDIKKLVEDNEFYVERYGEYFDWKMRAINREKELEAYKRALKKVVCDYLENKREFYVGKEPYELYILNAPEKIIKTYLTQARKELEDEKYI